MVGIKLQKHTSNIYLLIFPSYDLIKQVTISSYISSSRASLLLAKMRLQFYYLLVTALLLMSQCVSSSPDDTPNQNNTAIVPSLRPRGRQLANIGLSPSNDPKLGIYIKKKGGQFAVRGGHTKSAATPTQPASSLCLIASLLGCCFGLFLL
ncbi:hypothetical protein M5689_011701 [Euphorbia peplus]|nr:hypothetical protein M5689_011701 [Euphorbia peplus]